MSEMTLSVDLGAVERALEAQDGKTNTTSP
jgi:hypothetical protein